MKVALWILAVQGLFGAFDTLYFHEYRACLPAGGLRTRPELRLHAARSIIYAVVFGLLPHRAPHGLWAVGLALLLLAEIVITLADFVVEVKVREPEGVLAGERVTHAVMAILYGAFLSHLIPAWMHWVTLPTALSPVTYGTWWLGWLLSLMGLGVLLSGLRDAYAAFGGPGSAWPYEQEKRT